ncbi:hypothetical protein PIIN_02747 [Serendipita indica DSM 11827]|uniref:RecQ-mediated genome instability protein 1 n=1 Tax=Serendipita indica (strain DSM 11827) TaxID=1109443 RepID=G4TC40_SERID|nr:hypothetical protein PIIN_02747 [Serendipita indica DSM 11827]
MASARVTRWIEQRYSRPKLDPNWVAACVEFLESELQLRENDTEQLSEQVLLQLLQSDLCDSAMRDTGFPNGIQQMKNGIIGTRASGGPILVQIVAITDIGVSAFTLKNVRQSRLDKADMTGLTKEKDLDEEGADGAQPPGEDEDATMPPYPRSMLSLLISDGTVTIKAIEAKRFDGLVLGETPLGCKLLLTNVRVRNGIAMLDPSNTQVVGYQSDELQAHFDINFVKSLRRRMGQPEEDPEDERLAEQQQQRQAAQPVEERSRAQAAQRPPANSMRSEQQQQLAGVQLSETLTGARPIVPQTVNESFDDMPSELDDDFLEQIDEVEQKVLSTQPSTTPTNSTNPRRAQSNRLASTIQEIFELDSSEEEKENINKRRPRAPVVQVETIELSD